MIPIKSHAITLKYNISQKLQNVQQKNQGHIMIKSTQKPFWLFQMAENNRKMYKNGFHYKWKRGNDNELIHDCKL